MDSLYMIKKHKKTLLKCVIVGQTLQTLIGLIIVCSDRQMKANSADPDLTDNCLLCLQSLSAVSRSVIPY